MSEQTSNRRRLIGVAYWAVWGWAAAAVGLCAAAATWIGVDEVLLLTLIGLPIMVACGLWAAVLLKRSAATVGRRRVGWLILVCGAALVVSSGALAGWTIYRVQGLLRDQYLADWRTLLRGEGLWWGWGFTAYQLVALVITAAVMLAVGWLLERLARSVARRRASQHPEIMVSKWRLATTLLVSVVLLPAMMFGGFELSRRLGMAEFLLVYERSARAMAVRMRPSLTPESRYTFMTPIEGPGPFGLASRGKEDSDDVSLHLLDPTGLYRGRVMTVWLGEAKGRGDPPSPHAETDMWWCPHEVDRRLWGGWEEFGESLDLPLPWQEVLDLYGVFDSGPCLINFDVQDVTSQKSPPKPEEEPDFQGSTSPKTGLTE